MDVQVLAVMSSMFQGVLAGIVLTAAVAVCLKLYGNTSASTRFAVWWVCLVATVALTFAPMAVRTAESTAAPPQPPSPVVSATVAAPAVAMETPSERVSFPPAEGIVVPIPVDAEDPGALLALYLITVAVLFLRLILSYGRLVRLKRKCKPAPPELQERLEQWTRISECRRSVELLVSPKARCPMAVGLGRPAMIFPESLLLELTAEQLDHIALHELAHLRRYDDWNTLAQRLLRAAFFFHPAVHWISRRMEFEREVACDDSVLSVVEQPRRYAESLTRVAELVPSRRTPILASGAVFRNRQIFRRVRTMLNTARDRRPRVSQVSVALVVLVVLGITSELAQLPAFVAMIDGRQYHRTKWSVDGRTVEMQMSGDIEFGEDDASVTHVPPSGFLRIEERSGWRGRSLEFRPDSVRYRENGIERPFDDAGRAWLATLLPKIIRENGINAEQRALRILSKEGPEALMREIDRISSDHSRSLYLRAAIDAGKLDAEALRQAAHRIRRMGSDHEKANLLIDVRNEYFEKQMQNSWFDAIDSINSDHDRRRSISEAIDRASVEPATMLLAARVIQRISSDHDKAEILKQVPLHLMTEEGTRAAVLRAADSISSDHDKARVLRAFVSRADVSSSELEGICRTAERISSDHEKANLLLEITPAGEPACLSAARSITSDNEKRRVLERVLTSGAAPETAVKAIEFAAGISSDHDKAELLVRAAERYRDETVRAAIRKAAQGLSSDGEYRRLNSKLAE